MSVAERNLTNVTWETRLRRYGGDNSQSLGDVARWASSRPSLRVACELLGADDSEAGSLGKWLDKQGYHVPPLSTVNDYKTAENAAKGVERPNRRKRAQTVPVITVQIPLSKPESDELPSMTLETREDVIRLACALLRHAAYNATEDAQELGVEDVAAIVERYMRRKAQERV